MPLNDRVILFINGSYTEQKMEKITSNLMSFDEIIPPELINLSQEVEIDDVLPVTHTYSNCGHQF
ncbi:hypothetical protein CMK18_09855 [Candidatus Poribacteria bacterium]|nr:hypothetical protein [Candidatus Poribacteria bacterium]